METRQNQDDPKAPYERPVLRRIELRTEEVLAPGCKTISTSYPTGSSCWQNSCSQPGS